MTNTQQGKSEIVVRRDMTNDYRQTLIRDAKSAIGRAQNLISECPNDRNAQMLELNEAYGILENVLMLP